MCGIDQTVAIDSEIQCGLFVFQQSYLNARFLSLRDPLAQRYAVLISQIITETKAKICIILKRDYKLILFAKPSQKPSSDDFAQNYRTFSKKSYLEHHMTAARNGVTMKHFAGIELFDNHVHSAANSANAAKFLRELIENAPYKAPDRGPT